MKIYEIENLKLQDLKMAFKKYMEEGVELDRYQMRREWKKFYKRIADKCNIIEVE